MVSDGVLLIVGVNIAAAFFGNTIFHHRIFDNYDLSFSNFMFYLMSFIVVANFFER